MTDRCGMTEGRSRLRLVRRSALAAVVAGAVLAVTAAPASAAGNVPATAPLDLWGVDGTANAVVVSGSTVYVGGSFNEREALHAVGPEGQRDGPDPGHAQAGRQPQRVPSATDSDNGAVRALAVDASWLYLGGDFTSVDGVMRSHVARVNRMTGALDQSWNVTADKTVRDMVLVGDDALPRR